MKKSLEQSSRFISLSGLSGVFVGFCGLLGTYIMHYLIRGDDTKSDKEMLNIISSFDYYNLSVHVFVGEHLIFLAIYTVIFAILFAFYLTLRRSKRENHPIWDIHIQKQLSTLSIPLIVGLIFVIKLVASANYPLIVPSLLLFYGIALVNIRGLTNGDIGYLGYAFIVLGIVNLWLEGWGILFFGFGFGVLHIIYGTVTFIIYERHTVKSIRYKGGKW